MKGYTTKNKVENFLNKTISLSGTEFGVLIEAAEKYIDKYTDRNFIADSSPSYRYYGGNQERVLSIDDCVEVSEVSVGKDFYGDNFTVVDTSGTDRYYLLPENNVVDISSSNEEAVPVNAIFLRSRFWIRGIRNHKIKAKWGWSVSVPSDVGWVATFLVASLYNRGRSGSIGGVKAEKIGQYSVDFSTENNMKEFEQAKSILDSYKRFTL